MLLTLTEPPPAMDEEFNAWYDEEHLPERLAIPGFRSARRWVSGNRTISPPTSSIRSRCCLRRAYLARYQNQTPWSRRCLGKCLVFKRWACERTRTGSMPSRIPPPERSVMDDSPASPVLQSRRFVATSGEHIALHELGTYDERLASAYRLYQP